MRVSIPALLTIGLASLSVASIDPCRFNFGKGYKNSVDLTGIDYVTIYGGDNAAWNQYWHGSMVNAAYAAGVTPVFYGYMSAFSARQNASLTDCDVGSSGNLCTGGAAYIKAHRSEIISLYSTYAQNTAAIIGTNGASVWLIEPDLYQYSKSGSDQRGAYNGQYQSSPIPDDSIGFYFRDIAAAIRAKLPNAKVAVDISPWIANPSAYYANFDKSIIDYAFTSGGRTEAGNSKIRGENPMTWASIHNLLGKPIIADAGYGAGGGATGHDANWDVEANIEARIADGVIAITQFTSRDDWNSAVLSSLRPNLPSVGCSVSSSSSTPSSSSSAVSSSSSVPVGSSSAVSSSSVVGSSSAISSSSSVIGNLVQNGDFSQGTTYWDMSAASSAGASASSAVANGVLSTTINWGGNDSTQVQVLQAGISVTAGHVYSLTFDAATESGQTRPFAVDMSLAGQSWSCLSASLGSSLSQYQCELTAGSSGNADLRFLLGGPYWQDFLLDNVVLLETGVVSSSSSVMSSSSSDVVVRRVVPEEVSALGMTILMRGGRELQVSGGLGFQMAWDSRGRLLASPRISSQGRVDFSHQPSGTFILQFQGEQGVRRVILHN